MIRVGIIGVGGISTAHLNGYNAQNIGRITALCDIDPARARGEGKPISINLGAEASVAVQAKAYTDYRKLLANPDIDAVDICLPTYLHAEVAVAALRAGKHVLCEKPMALTVEDCDKMVQSAEESKRILMVAHCIRFWPEYLMLKSIVESGQYGKVNFAKFTRLGAIPGWNAANNWFRDPKLSGGSILDLHIHDADFIAYLFGMPESVQAFGTDDAQGISQVCARYDYADGKVVTADSGWYYGDKLPFRMTFLVGFEHGAIEWDSARGPLTIYPESGDPIVPEVTGPDGYSSEIVDFLECIIDNRQPAVVTPWEARESIRLIHAEIASVRGGQPVTL